MDSVTALIISLAVTVGWVITVAWITNNLNKRKKDDKEK